VSKLDYDRNGITLCEGAQEQNAKKNISMLERRIKERAEKIT
jgi:D-mannonate dehydratase